MCFDIPVLVQRFPIGPDPDPTIVVRVPRSQPWIQAQGMTPEIVATLANMATIMDVAERLDDEVPAMMKDM